MINSLTHSLHNHVASVTANKSESDSVSTVDCAVMHCFMLLQEPGYLENKSERRFSFAPITTKISVAIINRLMF